jgi:hypothetical protein
VTISKRCDGGQHWQCTGRTRASLDRIRGGVGVDCACSCHAVRTVSTRGGGTIGVLRDGSTVRMD